ncbi:SAM-dependent methyltransferase [Dysgonomonas sp. PH5-45]|uniref:class I SAM-dependent methyltransferase n=1 Tax=unclassified Dysgonomonas TaxID=2630389 RepID=UPI0024769E0A|nr:MULTISPECIES: methyltransferase domain-containing protein [unclassified Dysgonomonas]MDH6354299.1 SAM-dependent methyltransferase [Dysgonomonas sp. PH5-45]MDH6387200.1 SAM-dependent methyltransferase [Dysgonomonas sp. PH5-37]
MKNLLINYFHFFAGILFLLLAKVRKSIYGYTPKPFTTEEVQRCIEYDLNIVDDWLKQLKNYTKSEGDLLKDKSILELGPGSDLGIGLSLLAKGAKKYTAVDIYDLVANVPDKFYEQLFVYFKKTMNIDTVPLQEEFVKLKNKEKSRLNYVCRKDFDIKKALDDEEKVDIIFSNAAFEHFDNVKETIKNVSSVVGPGGKFIILVDLQTHSRWIREKDPNNIYRYPQWLYSLLSTQSTPNRTRPYKYEEALSEFGWENISVYSNNILGEEMFSSMKRYLNKDFKGSRNQMEYLTAWICATKKADN